VKFRYKLVRFTGYLLAWLPLGVLYLLARFTAFIFHRVAAYRKGVILENLKKSFPEKTDQEILNIARDFYRIFMETMFETVKLLRMDPRFLPARITLKNQEILDQYFKEGRSVIAVGGHYGNWEWMGTGLKALVPFRVIVVYKPLSDPAIDKLMYKIRTTNGSELIPMKKAFREIHSSTVPTFSYLLADQAPNPDNAHWMWFLNQETPVFHGPERIARLTNSVVVFLRIERTGLGKYSVTIQELCADPSSEPEGSITEKHVKALEKQIIENPAPWLWSHKRWKHKRRHENRSDHS
jgi:Kdo2-lipid IVA lauroyltransferase/acyltransferase